MLTESGRVVAVDDHYVWVETISRSSCGSCAAKSGCGHSLLARWASHTNYLKIARDQIAPRDLQVNDQVTLGVPEDVVLKSAMMLYGLPLLGAVLLALLGQTILAGDLGAVLGALIGMLGGAYGVAVYSRRRSSQPRFQPTIVDVLPPLQTASVDDA